MSQEGNQADGSHANSVGEQSPESLKKESGEGEETGCEVEAEGKSEEQQEVEQQDRIYLFQWPDATITIARAKDETELKRQMQLLGSVENCRLTEYKGPLQINLKLAPIPGVWKDDPQFLEFVHKVDDKKKLRDDFTALFDSDKKESFADVKFVVEGKDIYAHKVSLPLLHTERERERERESKASTPPLSPSLLLANSQLLVPFFSLLSLFKSAWPLYRSFDTNALTLCVCVCVFLPFDRRYWPHEQTLSGKVSWETGAATRERERFRATRSSRASVTKFSLLCSGTFTRDRQTSPSQSDTSKTTCQSRREKTRAKYWTARSSSEWTSYKRQRRTR